MIRDPVVAMAAHKVALYEIATDEDFVQLPITLQRYRVAYILDKTLSDEETERRHKDIVENYVNMMEAVEQERYSVNEANQYAKLKLLRHIFQ